MTLQDISDEEDYAKPLPTKQKRLNFTGKFNTLKKILVIVLIGIVLGILIGHYYIEPFIDEETQTKITSCIEDKKLLNKEIDCLYTQVENPQQTINQCFES